MVLFQTCMNSKFTFPVLAEIIKINVNFGNSTGELSASSRTIFLFSFPTTNWKSKRRSRYIRRMPRDFGPAFKRVLFFGFFSSVFRARRSFARTRRFLPRRVDDTLG